MKNILFFGALIFLISCATTDTNDQFVSKQDNYVVILDLSDRIIQTTDQVDVDTSAIRAVFERFEKSVFQNLVVKSKDKFSIRIIPQNGSPLQGNEFENNLSIDMAKYTAAEKLIKLNQFRDNFSKQLALLYEKAIYSSHSNSYAGVDIWQYFNDQINSDLNSDYTNKVVILTDGYFDFEDHYHGIKKQNQSTTTAPLLAKMNVPNWEELTNSNQVGIIPVKLVVPAKWIVCSIHEKSNTTDLVEAQKLCFLWKNWLKASGATTIEQPIIYSSSNKIRGLILAAL